MRQATADHLEKMDAAVATAGIVPGEPLAPVLAEWRRSLAWAGELTARMADVGQAIEARLSAAPATGSAGTIDPAALVRLEEAAANGASFQAAKLARVHNRRTLALLGAGFALVAAAAGFGGYLAGRSSAVATVSAVQAAAVRDGPEAAALWAQLMAANDGRLVAQICKETGARSEGGRHACALGLWLEPPTNSIPQTSPRR